jgi:hypothetical protein
VRARAQGQLTACKSNLKNIGTALEMYSTDNGGKYPEGLGALTPKYLKTIPECPAAMTMTYLAQWGPTAEDNTGEYLDFYSVRCAGKHHASLRVDSDYPRYTSVVGLIERAESRP